MAKSLVQQKPTGGDEEEGLPGDALLQGVVNRPAGDVLDPEDRREFFLLFAHEVLEVSHPFVRVFVRLVCVDVQKIYLAKMTFFLDGEKEGGGGRGRGGEEGDTSHIIAIL